MDRRLKEFTDSASRVGELSTGSSPGGDEFTDTRSAVAEISARRPGGQILKNLAIAALERIADKNIGWSR